MFFWFRGWMAAQDTAQVYKDHPIPVAVATVVIDAAAALGTYAVHQAVWAVAVAIVAGTVAVIAAVFLWALFTGPRRELDVRVGTLEQALESVQSQLTHLVTDRFGEPMQFLPLYQTLRTDVREAIRIIGHAKTTGTLWSRLSAPEYREWRKHKDAIATNPFALLDGIHGELLEAFDHVERLATKTSMRFGPGRMVRPDDDLDAALETLDIADVALTGAINRLEGLSALQKPSLDQLELGDEE